MEHARLPHKGSFKPVLYSALVAFVFLSSLIFCSWIQNDEWHFAANGLPSFSERFKSAWWSYLHHVSRVGELMIYLLGFSVYRWQAWVFTPIFASIAPLCLFALVRKNGDSLGNKRGVFFYWCFFFLFLLCVYLPRWRNYWCYAAAANYLYPTVLTMYWLSWFRTDRIYVKSGWMNCLFLFVLGVICGWGTECMSATLVPLVSVWGMYALRKKLLPLCSYFGYAGFLWGAMALFGSPAHAARAAAERSYLSTDIAQMSSEQLDFFLENLTWDSLLTLKGSTSVILLRDIPVWLHYHFIPFISERFWECCMYGVIVWLLFALCMLSFGGFSRRSHLFVSICILAVAYLCAISYVVQCIPTPMSFLPPCFIVVIACAYLYCRLPSTRVQKILSSIVTLAGCVVFIPAGIQAATYKHLDFARIRDIREQKALGKQDIVLKSPDVDFWWPSLGLIAPNDLNESPEKWPNPAAARYFGVSTIRQESSNQSKNR